MQRESLDFLVKKASFLLISSPPIFGLLAKLFPEEIHRLTEPKRGSLGYISYSDHPNQDQVPPKRPIFVVQSSRCKSPTLQRYLFACMYVCMYVCTRRSAAPQGGCLARILESWNYRILDLLHYFIRRSAAPYGGRLARILEASNYRILEERSAAPYGGRLARTLETSN